MSSINMDSDFFFYSHVDAAKKVKQQQQQQGSSSSNSQIVDPGIGVFQYTPMLGQQGIWKNNYGKYFLDVAINNPNGKKLRMMWDSGSVINVVPDNSAKLMGIAIPKDAPTNQAVGFGGEQITLKVVPVTLYMPRAAPVQTTINIQPNVIGTTELTTATVVAVYDIDATPDGIRFTPKGATKSA